MPASTTLDLNGANVTLPDGTVFTTTYLTGSNNVTNNVTNNGSANATLTEGGGPANTTYSGTISDGATHTTAITQTSGFVDFTGTNSYSGDTNLQGGTIGVGNNSALGNGNGTLNMATGTTLQADAATVALSNNMSLTGSDTFDSNGDTLTLFGEITSGAGSLTKISAGTLNFFNNNSSYSAAITLQAGTIGVANSNSALGNGGLNMSGGTTLQFESSLVLNNALTLTGSDTIDTTNQSPTLSGMISGTGALNVIAEGGESLTLSDASNNYSGGTTIVGAEVTITADGDLGATSGGVTLGSASSNGTLIFAADVSMSASRAITLVANNGEVPDVLEVDSGDTATVASLISGSGGLYEAGSGTLVLDGNNSAYTGQTTLGSGTLVIGNNNALGTNALYMTDGTTLRAGASTLVLPNGISLVGSDTIDTNGETLTMVSNFFQNGAPSSLVKVGAGKLVLDNANNNYTGGTTLSAGTLELAVFNSVNAAIRTGVTFTAAGATLQLDGGVNQIGGNIAGAVTGDNIGLGFLTYATGDHAVWTPSGGGGTLAVETAGDATLASLTLSGGYSTSAFTVGADGQNRVVVTLGTGPTVNTGNPNVSYMGGGSPVVVDSGLSVADSGSATLASATVQITGGTFAGDGDVLTANTTNTFITASYNSATETLTLSGTDTLADYQLVMRQVTFATTNSNATNSGADPSRTVSWTINDGTILTSPVTTTVGVANPPAPPPPAGPAPAGTTAAMIMRDGNNGNYEIYDLGSNSILAAGYLGQVGLAWHVAGVGAFDAPNNPDMILRNNNTGAFEIYDISNNAITGAAAMGQVGLEWSVAGFGDFSSRAGETDMLMRNSNTGAFEIYDLANNTITFAAPMGQVGLEWSVAGFGDFSTRPNETDMLMRNNNTGAFEIYDISNNQLTSAAPMGQVGLEWSVAGFGDFSANANETDMLMRNSNTGAFEIYDISNSQLTSAAPMGQVGLEWSVVGFGSINGAGTSDMLMRNNNTGAFEVYDITNNQLTSAAPMGQVGLEWSVAGIAADPPVTANAQLVQAMASVVSGTGVSTGVSSAVSAETPSTTLLTLPQHA